MLRLSNMCSMYNHWKQVCSEDDSSYFCEELYKDEKYLEIISLSLLFSVASGLEIKISTPRDADRLDI